MIIAVDGPTASGKGTISKALAAHFGLPMLDTGLLYRAAARQLTIIGGDVGNPNDAQAACDFPAALLDDPVLRNEEMGGLASRISVHPGLRAALKQRQVDFAGQRGGGVLDGRDIGTVIAPQADAKLFVTATAEVRAERRYSEMQSRQLDVDYANILADIRARDKRDIERADAPLKMAEDALLLDTSNLTIGAAVQAAIAAVEARLRSG